MIEVNFELDLGNLDRLVETLEAREISRDIGAALKSTAAEIADHAKERAPVVSSALQQSIGVKTGKSRKMPYAVVRSLHGLEFQVPGHSNPVYPVAYSGQRDEETQFLSGAARDSDVEALQDRVAEVVNKVLSR
jgi:hypothetical protein